MTSPYLSPETQRRVAEQHTTDTAHRSILWWWTLLGVMVAPAIISFIAILNELSFGGDPLPESVRQSMIIATAGVAVQVASGVVVIALSARWRVGTVQVLLTVCWLCLSGLAAGVFFTSALDHL
ncbi:hypothetical protein DVJ78_18345 (plasmid) [Humibacter sp. BT305]|nr:hypothetical protein DVJ78_18345 [Humibacter sp. BT305]